MKKTLFKKIITGLVAGSLLFGVTGCGKTTSKVDAKEDKTIKIGVSAGPYNDLFNAGVKPILEKQGYKIELIDFSDLLQSNVAITEGNIDFNVAQHTAYANNFNEEKGANLVPIVHIPTVPTAIFSNKHTSIKDVKEGQKVAIPKDPSNAARAFRLLQKAGWIKVKDGVDATKLTLNDITENPYKLDIIEMESAQIPRALDDLDFAILPGSVVYSSKIDISKSLLPEDVIDELEIAVTIDKSNVDSRWAKDIVAAYKSDEFKDYLSKNNKNDYWQIPDDLFETK